METDKMVLKNIPWLNTLKFCFERYGRQSLVPILCSKTKMKGFFVLADIKDIDETPSITNRNWKKHWQYFSPFVYRGEVMEQTMSKRDLDDMGIEIKWTFDVSLYRSSFKDRLISIESRKKCCGMQSKKNNFVSMNPLLRRIGK